MTSSRITASVNGKAVLLEEGTSLKKFLEERFITSKTQGVAVAYNDSVTQKENWTRIIISSGAKIEIVHAVQGG